MNDAADVVKADVAVVGAGPGGLIAAITAAERGARVVVCEQLDRPGVKLLASGGGRCNLSNLVDDEPFMARFGRQGRFLQPSLAALSCQGLRDFLGRLGVATISPDGLNVYPASNSAVTVQSALWRRCRELGVQFLFRSRVIGLWLEEGRLLGAQTESGRIAAGRVVLATGGKSYPELGGTGGGYELARQGGHTLADLAPALVPLLTEENWPAECTGLSLNPGRVWIDLPRQPKAGVAGDVLFTHQGLSGPAVLDLSGDVSERLAEVGRVPIRLDFQPGTTFEQWRARFEQWGRTDGAKMFRNLLGRLFRDRLAETLCSLAGVARTERASQIRRGPREALARLLTAMPLTVVGTGGFARAIVTRGGVKLKEVDPRTLASRKLPGLFLAGEVLDLDGPCGGYNIQMCFSTGRLAGMSVVEERDRD